MWFLKRKLWISGTAKKSNKTVGKGADTTRLLINRIPDNLFWQCDEKRDTRTACKNRKD